MRKQVFVFSNHPKFASFRSFLVFDLCRKKVMFNLDVSNRFVLCFMVLIFFGWLRYRNTLMVNDSGSQYSWRFLRIVKRQFYHQIFLFFRDRVPLTSTLSMIPQRVNSAPIVRVIPVVERAFMNSQSLQCTIYAQLRSFNNFNDLKLFLVLIISIYFLNL